MRRRVTIRKMQTNKFAIPAKPDGNRQRAPYFHSYRHERTALSVLENTFSGTINYKNDRANRYIYHQVIPYLNKFLTFEPDRVRLGYVEMYFYNQILSYRFQKGHYEEPYRIPLCVRGPSTIVDGTHRRNQTSIEFGNVFQIQPDADCILQQKL